MSSLAYTQHTLLPLWNIWILCGIWKCPVCKQLPTTWVVALSGLNQNCSKLTSKKCSVMCSWTEDNILSRIWKQTERVSGYNISYIYFTYSKHGFTVLCQPVTWITLNLYKFLPLHLTLDYQHELSRTSDMMSSGPNSSFSFAYNRMLCMLWIPVCTRGYKAQWPHFSQIISNPWGSSMV